MADRRVRVRIRLLLSRAAARVRLMVRAPGVRHWSADPDAPDWVARSSFARMYVALAEKEEIVHLLITADEAGRPLRNSETLQILRWVEKAEWAMSAVHGGSYRDGGFVRNSYDPRRSRGFGPVDSGA